MDYGTDYAASIVCAMIDAGMGGAPVATTANELYKFAKMCRSASGWSRMSTDEKQAFVLSQLADHFGSD